MDSSHFERFIHFVKQINLTSSQQRRQQQRFTSKSSTRPARASNEDPLENVFEGFRSQVEHLREVF